MYSEMSNIDFLCAMKEKSHPKNGLWGEAGKRIKSLEEQVMALEAKVFAWEASADIAGVDTPDELVNYIIASGNS